jgi:hypothetical protein
LEAQLQKESGRGCGCEGELEVLKSTVYSLTRMLQEERERENCNRTQHEAQINENAKLLKELALARIEIQRLTALLKEQPDTYQPSGNRKSNSLNQTNNKVVKSSKDQGAPPTQTEPAYHTSTDG